MMPAAKSGLRMIFTALLLLFLYLHDLDIQPCLQKADLHMRNMLACIRGVIATLDGAFLETNR